MPVLILETESLAPPTQTLPPSPPGLLRKKTVRMMRSAVTALTVLSDARTAHRESAGFLTGLEENHRSTGANTQNLIFLHIHPVTSPPSPSIHTFTNNPIKPTSISFGHQTMDHRKHITWLGTLLTLLRKMSNISKPASPSGRTVVWLQKQQTCTHEFPAPHKTHSSLTMHFCKPGREQQCTPHQKFLPH
jgi:hypothetical protein